MNYESVMDHMEQDRISRARLAIMSYPWYSDETRAVWMDALEGMQETRNQAMKNAHDALEEAFNKSL